MTNDGLLRGACHRARIRATRWLAMTAVSTPIPLLLFRPLIGDAPDHGGIAEFPAQVVDCAFGVRRAAVAHGGGVGLRSRGPGPEPRAHHPAPRAADLVCQPFWANPENVYPQLSR